MVAENVIMMRAMDFLKCFAKVTSFSNLGGAFCTMCSLSVIQSQIIHMEESIVDMEKKKNLFEHSRLSD